MASKLFVHTKDGFKPLPDPPGGKGYLVVPVPDELCARIGELDGRGHYERELALYLEDAILQFFRTRGVQIATPPRIPEGLKLYDPRDPLKERIN